MMELLQNLAFLHDYSTAMLLRQNAWDCAIWRRFIGRMDLCTEGSAHQVWVVWHALKFTRGTNNGSFNTWLHNKCMSESPVLFSTLWARVCHHGKMCIRSVYCSREYHRSSFENLPGIIFSVCEYIMSPRKLYRRVFEIEWVRRWVWSKQGLQK